MLWFMGSLKKISLNIFLKKYKILGIYHLTAVACRLYPGVF